MSLLASLGLALSVSTASAIHQGALKIEIDKETVDLHVVARAEKGMYFSTNDRSLTMKWGGEIRGFLAKHAMDEMLMENYYNFTLLDKELSYDIDLGNVGCSCNAALFHVTMPGYNPDGTIARGNENPYYCDANQVGGVWCWEHDTIEGNKYTMATTPHTCNQAPGQYIDGCDRGGCGVNAWTIDEEGMCPSDKCSIDTRKPFRHHQRFEANWKGKLVRIVNRLSQDGNLFSWEACPDAEYLEKMTVALQGHTAMVFQLWGTTEETMSWLDGMTGCKGACIANETQVTFSDIRIRSFASPHDDVDVVVV